MLRISLALFYRGILNYCPFGQFAGVQVVRHCGLVWLWTFLLGSLAGCTGAESRLPPPQVDVEAVGKAAVAQHDAGGDGAIDGVELENAPVLKNSLSIADANKDGKLTAEEIAAPLAPHYQAKVAMMPLSAQVSLNGAPLADAIVTLVPEKFMGDAVKTATGTTDSSGLCQFAMSEQDSGTNVGYFRIEVSKKQGGQELVPAKYNSQTQLGGFIAPGSTLINEGSLVLKLSGK